MKNSSSAPEATATHPCAHSLLHSLTPELYKAVLHICKGLKFIHTLETLCENRAIYKELFKISVRSYTLCIKVLILRSMLLLPHTDAGCRQPYSFKQCWFTSKPSWGQRRIFITVLMEGGQCELFFIFRHNFYVQNQSIEEYYLKL